MSKEPLTEKRVILAGAPNGLLRGAAAALERAGFDVASVEVLEVLEAFAAGRPPDLVIVDEAFGMDGGVALCRHLREECLVAGINDFMLAPFPEDELLDKVRRLTVIPARREMNTLVRVREGRPDGQTILGKTLNISINGILLEIESLLGIGRAVELEFFLPEDAESIRATGRVIRRALELDLFHPAFGVRFLEVNEHDRKRIERFIARREQSASGSPP
jgi:hypothetical protein